MSTSGNTIETSTTTTTNATTTATTTTPDTTANKNSDASVPVGTIVGSVVGALLGVACVVLIIIFILRRYKCRMNGNKERPPLPDLRPPPITAPPPEVSQDNDTTYETQDEVRGNSLALAPRTSLDDLPQVPPVSTQPVATLIPKAVSENHLNKGEREALSFPRDDSNINTPYISRNQRPPAHRINKGYVNEPKGQENNLALLKENANELSHSNENHSKVSRPSNGLSEDYIDMNENLPNLTPQKYNKTVKAAEDRKANIKEDNIIDERDTKNYVNFLKSSRQDIFISDDSSEQLVLSETNSIKDSSDEDEREEYINMETLPNITQHLNETTQNITEASNKENSSPETNHNASHINGDKSSQDYINVGNLVVTPPEVAKIPTLKHSQSSSTRKQENNSPKNTTKTAPPTLPKPKAIPAVENQDPLVEITNNVTSLDENDTSENQQTTVKKEDDNIYINSGEKISNISEHLKSLNTLKDMPPKTLLGVLTSPQKPHVSPKPTRPKV